MAPSTPLNFRVLKGLTTILLSAHHQLFAFLRQQDITLLALVIHNSPASAQMDTIVLPVPSLQLPRVI
jgi:hypothetical protein